MWILLPEANASMKAVLKFSCLRYVSFMGSKGAFVSSFNIMKMSHFDKFLELLWSFTVKGGEQPVQLQALGNMEP